VNYQGEGQNHKLTFTGIDAAANPISVVNTRIYDGMPHPRTGNPAFDAVAWTRVDAYIVIISDTKAGKLVRTETGVVSPDGKTLTNTTTQAIPNGPPINNISVYDKQ
jgi:hypothetical protein